MPALRVIECCFTASFLFTCIGLAGVLSGLVKFFATSETPVLLVPVGVLVSIGIVWLGLRVTSEGRFLCYLTSAWLVSRTLVVVLFPKFFPVGDEANFHNFVTRLEPAIAGGSIAALSNIYDYPVWLSRAFPVYLPLALLFGPNDLVAARFMNVLLGAAQLVILFFIAKAWAGERVARLACLLYFVFPYHWINVLSYDPQIAGTFFLLLAIYMFVLLQKPRAVTQGISIGIRLGFSLLFAGVQRGGIDLLLVAVMFAVVLLSMTFANRIMNRYSVLTLVLSVGLVWLPCRMAFGHWIDSNDAHHLRTHALGFMTRGWNLEAPGEYLPLYEQLDMVSPRAEKNRLLEAILVTEFARQPVRALIFLPIVKVAKLLAVGYASTAEVGLDHGGYGIAADIYRGLRSVYAPVILALCAYGLFRCISRENELLSLILPVLMIAFSCAGIALLWETSPRYSHHFHFAIVTLAAFGLVRLMERNWGWRNIKAVLYPLGVEGLMMACGWATLATGIVVTSRLSKSLQLADPRELKVSVNGTAAKMTSLHPLTQSWEDGVELQSGTVLPAKVMLLLPGDAAKRDYVLHLWLPDVAAAQNNYQVAVGEDSLPEAASGRIERVIIPGDTNAGLTLTVRSKDGALSAPTPLKVGIGFMLPK